MFDYTLANVLQILLFFRITIDIAMINFVRLEIAENAILVVLIEFCHYQIDVIVYHLIFKLDYLHVIIVHKDVCLVLN